MIGCLQDEKEGLADAKSGQSQKVSVFTTASREEIQAFIKEDQAAVTQEGKTNGSAEEVISPVHYVKLLGEEAEAGIVQLMKEGKASQWVFYKQEGKLQANRVRVVRQSGTGKDSSFTGIIEVSALKARAWTAYVYKKDTLEKVYSGNGLLSNASNQCLEPMYRSMKPDEDGGGGGSGTPEDPYQIPEVVVTAHRRSPGSSSSSWGSGSSFDSRGIGSSSWGSGVGYPAGPVSPGSWGGGGGGSYSGDDGESYYGGEIGAVTVTAHKKKKEEPERSGVILSPLPPLLPAGELIDERGEPLREKQEPPEKKEEEKDKKEPCKTTVEDLQKVFPGTDSGTLKEIADLVNQYGKDFGINDDETLRYFISQAGAETKNMTKFTEGTTYHLSRLSAVWKYKFNTIESPTNNPNKRNPNDFARSKGSTLADPVKLFNFVYGGKYGNNTTGDGYKYRGRGLLHLTWKSNYEDFTKFYQENYDSTKDFVAHPELLNDNKKIGVISALWYFKNHVIPVIKRRGKNLTSSVSKSVNGGNHGKTTREILYKKAKTNVKCH